MKRIFATIIAISFLACNNEKNPAVTAEAQPSVPANMYGFTPSYSASFVMDSAANTETVLALWKEWKDGDLSQSHAHFADSVTFFLADGSMMSGPSDSMIKNMQGYRSSFKSIDPTIEAIFSTRSTDRGDNWVAVWGHEVQTDMKGKVDTVSLQETWRFNKAGKVNMMFQAMRKGMLPPAPPMQ